MTESTERDVLLATKVTVPFVRPDVVPRERLVQRLEDGRRRGLVLVCAPAGYGKTCLLAHWVREGRPPAAWLSLDPGDNDPARFWRHVVAALDRARPGIAERVGPPPGPPPGSYETLVTALINDVAGDEELLLVLDDYHVIDSRTVHDSLGFLLEHRSPGLQVAVTGRSDPPLGLARLRARGQLTELRAADLRFTPAEAAALLQQVVAAPGGAQSGGAQSGGAQSGGAQSGGAQSGGAQAGAALPEAVTGALAARTEGWAAGLRLAGLSLRGKQDVDAFVAGFTGSHRYVMDYLTEEVLERQPGPVQDFLLETSVLDQLSGDLCDAVTGRPGSQALLEQVEGAGLFLVPLDEVRGWWRFHHLFADLLRARLQHDRPARVEELHRNAAAWYAERGLADDAIRHALAAGETTWAARLIEQHYDELFYLRGEGATIRRWLSALPPELVRSRPRLLLMQILQALVGGRLEAAESLLDVAQQVGLDAADEPFEPTVGRGRSLLVNVAALTAIDRGFLAQLRGDAEITVASASQAMAEAGAGEWRLSSTARGFRAVAEWLRGDLARAEHTFLSGLDEWRAAGLPTLTAWVCYLLGQVQRAQGRLDAAGDTCREALERTAVPGRAAAPADGPAYVGLGEVAYQRNELDMALRHVTEGVSRCRRFAYPPPLASGLVALAWIRQAGGDPDAARSTMAEAEKVSPGPAALLNPVPAERARLLLAQGDTAAAARWVRENGLDAGDDPDFATEREHLVLARVLLAQDRAGVALPLLDRMRTAAAAQDRVGSLIEIDTLRALALAAGGDADRAVGVLAAALRLACPQGQVRVFADEGPPLAALLTRLIAAQRSGGTAAEVPLGYLARLQRAFGGPEPRPGSVPAAPGLIDPLTSRELEVLTMLAAGRSNQAIAGQLVVTLDTVKKHVSHVLGKLGATNRTEAVARARELRVIP